MEVYCWMRNCANCGQGRLLIMKDLSNDSLYLHCEDCEWGWRDPEKADNVASAFLTLNEEFEAAPASRAEIERLGWNRYVVGEFLA